MLLQKRGHEWVLKQEQELIAILKKRQGVLGTVKKNGVLHIANQLEDVILK